MIPPLKLDHLVRMTDEFGMFQFASGSSPNKDFGYTLDDNARALIVCSWLIQNNYNKELERLISIYFDFVKKCLQADGVFVNYIDFNGKVPSKQNANENLEDVQGRVLWALAEAITNVKLSLPLRMEAEKLFLISFKQSRNFSHLRAQAFAIKAFALALPVLPEYKNELLFTINKYSDFLLFSLKKNSDTTWNWFENHITYNIGLLPESLLIAGAIANNKEYTAGGLLSLTFLIDTTFSEDIYSPIGNSHWYKKSQKRSYYDQQPEDPTSMILTLMRAYQYTQKKYYKEKALQCFSWFFGNNSLGVSLYNTETGGCYDGLLPNKINTNQGAESLISYLMARVTIQALNE